MGLPRIAKNFSLLELGGISWVSVHMEYRNQGIGGQLVNKCIKDISKKIQSESFVILGTYPHKTDLYDRLGFHNMHHDNDHGAFMIRKIKPD